VNQPGKCVHFTGCQHETCAVGLRYDEVRKSHEPLSLPGGGRIGRSLPCVRSLNPAGVTCSQYREPTAEEIAADEAELQRHLTALGEGRSPCCNAPLIDRLVESGRYKGSGWRYCSECRKAVVHQCARGGR